MVRWPRVVALAGSAFALVAAFTSLWVPILSQEATVTAPNLGDGQLDMETGYHLWGLSVGFTSDSLPGSFGFRVGWGRGIYADGLALIEASGPLVILGSLAAVAAVACSAVGVAGRKGAALAGNVSALGAGLLLGLAAALFAGGASSYSIQFRRQMTAAFATVAPEALLDMGTAGASWGIWLLGLAALACLGCGATGFVRLADVGKAPEPQPEPAPPARPAPGRGLPARPGAATWPPRRAPGATTWPPKRAPGATTWPPRPGAAGARAPIPPARPEAPRPALAPARPAPSGVRAKAGAPRAAPLARPMLRRA